MIELIALVAWAASGVAIALRGVRDDADRLGWTPLASVLGPLWLLVAEEQRVEPAVAIVESSPEPMGPR